MSKGVFSELVAHRIRGAASFWQIPKGQDCEF